MPQPRREQIDLAVTPYYHCVSRCVRRAFLCGKDPLSGRNYDHRKGWIVSRLKTLGEVFAVDIAAYAVMANHVHLVLRIAAERAGGWSEAEVADRWTKLFRGHEVVSAYVAGEMLSEAEVAVARRVIGGWRERLQDLSWFMRCLNEPVARWANREDGCTGRFWEGRFKSQALLDEAALLACMAYVDLNPVRAGLSETPEGSDFTSIQQRLRAVAGSGQSLGRGKAQAVVPLLGFSEGREGRPGIPFGSRAYLELVDWTGRAIRTDKAGAIPGHVAPLLDRLGVEASQWTEHVKEFGRRFCRVIGREGALQAVCERQALRWLRGVRACRAFYGQAA